MHDAPIDRDEQRRAVELPWGLILAPRPAPGAVVTRHPSEPVDLDGATGLWRTRFGADAGDGNVAVAALRAGRPRAGCDVNVASTVCHAPLSPRGVVCPRYRPARWAAGTDGFGVRGHTALRARSSRSAETRKKTPPRKA